MSNDQLMELKWPLSVSCLHTPSLKHTYTLKHPHTGWKDPFHGSLTHQPLTHLFPCTLAHTDTHCCWHYTRSSHVNCVLTFTPALSGAVLNPHTHTHTSLKICEKKNDFFSFLILHFQKDPAVLSRSPPFLDVLPFLAKLHVYGFRFEFCTHSTCNIAKLHFDWKSIKVFWGNLFKKNVFLLFK